MKGLYNPESVYQLVGMNFGFIKGTNMNELFLLFSANASFFECYFFKQHRKPCGHVVADYLVAEIRRKMLSVNTVLFI